MASFRVNGFRAHEDQKTAWVWFHCSLLHLWTGQSNVESCMIIARNYFAIKKFIVDKTRGVGFWKSVKVYSYFEYRYLRSCFLRRRILGAARFRIGSRWSIGIVWYHEDLFEWSCLSCKTSGHKRLIWCDASWMGSDSYEDRTHNETTVEQKGVESIIHVAARDEQEILWNGSGESSSACSVSVREKIISTSRSISISVCVNWATVSIGDLPYGTRSM